MPVTHIPALEAAWSRSGRVGCGPLRLVGIPDGVARKGGEDRVVPVSHAQWLLAHIPAAELWLRPRDGHVSVLDAVPVAMDWLVANGLQR